MKILFNVDEDQQASIRACKTAMEMWDQLNTEYSLMAPDNAMISLQNFFHYNPGNMQLCAKCVLGLIFNFGAQSECN